MSRDCKLYLEDILTSIAKIEEYTKNLSFDKFHNNSLVVDGVVRNLEIIGEAAKNIPAEIKRAHSEIDWKKIAGLRDILIHEYSGINLAIVWDVVTNKLPILKNMIKKLLS